MEYFATVGPKTCDRILSTTTVSFQKSSIFEEGGLGNFPMHFFFHPQVVHEFFWWVIVYVRVMGSRLRTNFFDVKKVLNSRKRSILVSMATLVHFFQNGRHNIKYS